MEKIELKFVMRCCHGVVRYNYHRRSLGMIPVTAYRGVANRGPGALMNCPTFLPMGDNFCLIRVVKTRESKESA